MENYKLPKNIRQIGEKENWIRIYLEDYVNTYIHRSSGSEDSRIAGGILFGRRIRVNGEVHLYIKGAAVTQDPLWKEAVTGEKLEEIRKVNFPDLEICGWYLWDSDGQVKELELIKIFEEQFRNEYQVLFMMNGSEEDFFTITSQGFQKMAGYYIYYERNEEMQEYMVRDNEKENKEENPPQEQVKREQKEENAAGEDAAKKDSGKVNVKKLTAADKLVRTVSLAGIFLLAFFIFSNQNNLFNLSGSGEDMLTPESTTQGTLEAAATADSTEGRGNSSAGGQTEESTKTRLGGSMGQTEPESGQSSVLPGQSLSDQSQEAQSEASVQGNSGDEGSENSGESESVGAFSTIPESYTVQAGDNLYAICMLYYGDYSRVMEICELNNIENPNYLQMGTEIKLPQN